MKIRLKKEIVTIGLPEISPNKIVGNYIKPENWNDLISDKNLLLIDTRNSYEVSIGSFENALNPNIKSFREFPDWVTKNLINKDPEVKNKKVAMFCTGGIRCEKSTSYLKSIGFEEVYHLEGGILKYLEKVPKNVSKWKGSCFVFDYRVSVDHNLELGHYECALLAECLLVQLIKCISILYKEKVVIIVLNLQTISKKRDLKNDKNKLNFLEKKINCILVNLKINFYLNKSRTVSEDLPITD